MTHGATMFRSMITVGFRAVAALAAALVTLSVSNQAAESQLLQSLKDPPRQSDGKAREEVRTGS
jgi:hypothetical protein